METCGNYFFIE